MQSTLPLGWVKNKIKLFHITTAFFHGDVYERSSPHVKVPFGLIVLETCAVRLTCQFPKHVGSVCAATISRK